MYGKIKFVFQTTNQMIIWNCLNMFLKLSVDFVQKNRCAIYNLYMLFSYFSPWTLKLCPCYAEPPTSRRPNGESISCPRSFSGGPKWCNSTRPQRLRAESIGNPWVFMGVWQISRLIHISEEWKEVCFRKSFMICGYSWSRWIENPLSPALHKPRDSICDPGLKCHFHIFSKKDGFPKVPTKPNWETKWWSARSATVDWVKLLLR